MPIRLHYRNEVYSIERGHWRGRDGHMVHFLTWVTDDLLAGLAETGSDLDLARRVAERLGAEARVEAAPE